MTDKIRPALTPGSFWRKNYEEGIEVEMPSGAMVRMRPTIDITYLIATNSIPDSLTSIALEGINVDLKDKKALTTLAESVKKMDEVYRVACQCAWLHPRIVDNPTADDEIAYEWLSKEEKEYTWTLIQQPVSEWKSFLPKWRAGLESLPNGAGERPDGKRMVTG